MVVRVVVFCTALLVLAHKEGIFYFAALVLARRSDFLLMEINGE